MEKKHRCKLCFRNFANGRALGGHMRSHMMKFYAEEKAASKQEYGDDDDRPFDRDFQSLQSYSPPSSSSSSEEEEEEDYEEEEEREVVRGLSSYELRENPKKSAIMADHDFSAVVVQGGESETEYSSEKNPICRRRSKRVRESRISDLDVFKVKKKPRVLEEDDDEGKGNIVNEQSSPLSSISDTTPEEHVAHCLIMLSKDKWETKQRKQKKKVEINYQQEDDDEEEEEEESKKFGDYDVSQDSVVVAKMAVKNKIRGKYRCDECNKLFRSYQALGGHRASHKKIKAAAAAERSGGAAEAKKIHQCPFCDRIFSSGQALGGHKRSHFIGGAGAISSNYNSTEKNSTISQVFTIDLNLPAPLEDDEIAVSAVSDAEFVCADKE